MSPSALRRVATALALAGAMLAVVDVVAGLLVHGGYTAGYSYLHLLAVLTCAAAIVAGSIGRSTRNRRDLTIVGAAALAALQLPWSLAGLTGRPWFALAGVIASPLLLASAALLAWPRIELAARTGRKPARGPAAPVAPALGAGWYPDPAGGQGWRWWDGERWTQHTGEPGASGAP